VSFGQRKQSADLPPSKKRFSELADDTEKNLAILKDIVDRRAEVQKFSFALLKALKRAGPIEKLPKSDFHVSQLLIGCAFSLWRAAFLLDASRDPSAMGRKAVEFLEKFVTDNMITFQNDCTMKEWAVGYYLNNAKYRLQRVPQLGYEDTRGDLPEFVPNVEPAKLWDSCFKVLCNQFSHFASRNLESSTPSASA
jgi:hypothetical protein